MHIALLEVFFDLSQPSPIVGNVFYVSEIVVNEAENLSAIVIRPGINQNGFFYSEANLKKFSQELLTVPLVKDHSLKVEDNIGRWKKSEILGDGALKGSFQISAVEDKMLAKMKDGTIRYMSTAHTYGDKQTCTVCNTVIPPQALCKNHRLGQVYDGKVAALGFENPKLLHVSVVQNPADLGCAVINSFLAEKVENLSATILDAQTQYATVVAELKGVRDELERYRRLKFTEPTAKIAVTPPPPVLEEKRKLSWLGTEE